jgi:para-aminobenzoate synthetase component 1
MYPNFISFDFSRLSISKKQLLAWADSFQYFCFLDSNDHKLSNTSFDFIIGIDAIDIYESEVIDASFENWKKNEFIFGYFGFQIENSYQSGSFNNSKPLFWFKPRYILYLKNDKLFINRNYPEAFEIIERIQNQKIANNIPKPKINFKQHTEKEAYKKNFDHIIEQIKDGIYYELNYCMLFEGEFEQIDPISTFIDLNTQTKAPMAGILKIQEDYILSFSPERFVKKEDTTWMTQPIKGTSKRFSDKKLDAASKENLKSNLKERAENLMIVYMARNDLTHYAKVGSIQVKELCEIYSFEQVHQMISTITAKIDNDNTISALKAMMPAPSMTGSPKDSAMLNISKIENFERGIYSGNLGYFDTNGNFDLNVIIRSLYLNLKTKKTYTATGGAITIQSECDSEYNECLLKANFLIQYFN